MKCIFCRIVAGDEKAYIVYESDHVLAFLDKYPVSKGHTLIIPIKHYETIFETPDHTLYELVKIAKKIAIAQVEILRADGVRILQNNGRAAKQEIPHIHFHVIPFYHGVELRHPRRKIDKEEGEEVAKLLRIGLDHG